MPQLFKLYCLLLLICGISVGTIARAGETKRTVTETLLSKSSMEEISGNSYTVSTNLRRIAFLIKKGKKTAAVVDTIESKLYDEVTMPVFSPDCKRYAYVARDGATRSIIVDNKLMSAVDTSIKISYLQFTPDNKNLVIIINSREEYCILNTAVELPEKDADIDTFNFINENSIRFGANKNMAYAAKLNGKEYIVVNGKKSAPYDQVGFPEFHPDGKRITYWAIINKKYYFVCDKKKYGPYDELGTILFSPDGKEIIFNAMQKGKHVIVVNGKTKSDPYHHIESLALNPVTDEPAYVIHEEPSEDPHAEEEFTTYLIYKGQREGPYEQVIVNSIFFSPDGKNIAYCGQLPITTIVNGEEVELMDQEWFIMYNGKEGKRYNMLQGFPVFSANSLHMAYAGERDSKRWINIDTTEGIAYDDIYHITFSPDSKRLLFSAKQDNQEFVVIDDHNGKPYDALIGQRDFLFDSANTFHYIAVKENKIYLVEEKID